MGCTSKASSPGHAISSVLHPRICPCTREAPVHLRIGLPDGLVGTPASVCLLVSTASFLDLRGKGEMKQKKCGEEW